MGHGAEIAPTRVLAARKDALLPWETDRRDLADVIAPGTTRWNYPGHFRRRTTIERLVTILNR